MEGFERPRVIVVEDDRDVATLVAEVLSEEGFDAVTADHRATAAEVRRMRPRLVILDLFLGQVSARDLVNGLRGTDTARIPVLLMSAAHDVEEQARSLGASGFIRKPFDIDALVATCRGLAA